MPPKVKKTLTKKAPPLPPTPKRATVLLSYSFSGLNLYSMGFGGVYRRLREMLLDEFDRGEIEVVGSGSSSSTFPLEAKLVETGGQLGQLDWHESGIDSIEALAQAISKAVKKYLATPYSLNSTTQKLEPPGKFRGSASYTNILPSVSPKKKAKKKKAV
ncbi:hypothetical protein M885DRAFT_517392, partial [Pelagophyceae sp. CCMP2097]